MSQWIISKVQGGHHVIKRDEGHLPVVADVYGTDAEAKLIAAAPETARERDELLTACEELHSFAVGCAHHVRGRGSRQRAQAMFDRAREAIANAKGGE